MWVLESPRKIHNHETPDAQPPSKPRGASIPPSSTLNYDPAGLYGGGSHRIAALVPRSYLRNSTTAPRHAGYLESTLRQLNSPHTRISTRNEASTTKGFREWQNIRDCDLQSRSAPAGTTCCFICHCSPEMRFPGISSVSTTLRAPGQQQRRTSSRWHRVIPVICRGEISSTISK